MVKFLAENPGNQKLGDHPRDNLRRFSLEPSSVRDKMALQDLAKNALVQRWNLVSYLLTLVRTW